MVEANQGADGVTKVPVDSASYSSQTDLTTIVVKQAVLTANLISVKRGTGDKTSLGKHYHNDEETDAGLIPAALMNTTQVNAVIAALLPDPTTWPNGSTLVVESGVYTLRTE